jgi:hypothetical protein
MRLIALTALICGSHSLMALDATLGAVRIESRQDEQGRITGYHIRAELANEGATIRFQGYNDSTVVPVLEQQGPAGWAPVRQRGQNSPLEWYALHAGEAIDFQVPVAATGSGLMHWQVEHWPARIRVAIRSTDGSAQELVSRELPDPRLTPPPVAAAPAARPAIPPGFEHVRNTTPASRPAAAPYPSDHPVLSPGFRR